MKIKLITGLTDGKKEDNIVLEPASTQEDEEKQVPDVPTQVPTAPKKIARAGFPVKHITTIPVKKFNSNEENDFQKYKEAIQNDSKRVNISSFMSMNIAGKIDYSKSQIVEFDNDSYFVKLAFNDGTYITTSSRIVGAEMVSMNKHGYDGVTRFVISSAISQKSKRVYYTAVIE
jgi:hypothetical protein